MSYYLLKITITTVLIVMISEIAKRSTFVGAVLASIPLVSVLAMIWLYIDTRDVAKVSSLATSIFWLVVPSLALFVTLPLLLKQGINFYLSISVAILITVVCYGFMVTVLRHFGVEL
ncbi:MAG: DUF3147 family protein [bacterium]